MRTNYRKLIIDSTPYCCEAIASHYIRERLLIESKDLSVKSIESWLRGMSLNLPYDTSETLTLAKTDNAYWHNCANMVKSMIEKDYGAYVVKVKITSEERLNNSYNGNPRARFTTNEEQEVLNRADSSFYNDMYNAMRKGHELYLSLKDGKKNTFVNWCEKVEL